MTRRAFVWKRKLRFSPPLSTRRLIFAVFTSWLKAMFSASDASRAALRAGADVFLKKPDKVDTIVKTITGLVGVR